LINPDEKVDCSHFGVWFFQVTIDKEPEPDAIEKEGGHDDNDDYSPIIIKVEWKWKMTITSHEDNLCLIMMHELKCLHI
jgi:hypothetical protein